MEDEKSALGKYVFSCCPLPMFWISGTQHGCSCVFSQVLDSGSRTALPSWAHGTMKSPTPGKSSGRHSKLNASNKAAQDGRVHTEPVLGQTGDKPNTTPVCTTGVVINICYKKHWRLLTCHPADEAKRHIPYSYLQSCYSSHDLKNSVGRLPS